jgi:hypothetical protein
MRLHLNIRKYLFFVPTASLVVGLVATGIVLAGKPAGAPAFAAKNVSASKVPGSDGELKIGAYIASDHNASKIERTLGTELDMVGWYTHWSQPMVNNKLVNACKDGYVPSITWESWNGFKAFAEGDTDPYPMTDIAAGTFDAKIIADLQGIAKTCGNQTVLIRFDHEMNLATRMWYPWQGDTHAYITAWQHVVALGRQYAPNVKWVWGVNRGDAVAQSYYPGNEYVDYVGITLNQSSYEPRKAQSFAKFYEQNNQVLESFGKPILIAETAAVEGVSPTRKADWIDGMFSYLKHKRQVVGLLWFNEVAKDSAVDTSSYKVDSSPVALKALQDGIAEARAHERK